MSDKKIVVKINAIGKPLVEAVGFNGVGCTEATASIEKALAGGNGSVDRTFKPEWEQSEAQGEQEQQSW